MSEPSVPELPAAPGGAWRSSLGLATVLAGQPIAWTVRGIVGGGKNPVYPIVAILLGFALLVRVDWFRRPVFYPAPRLVGAIVLLWLVPLAALSLLAPADIGLDGAYAVFLAGLAFGIALTPIAALRRLPEAMTIVGGTSSILALGTLVFGHVAENFVRLTVAGTDNQAIAGIIGGITMITALLVVRTSARPGFIVGLATGIAFVAGLAAVALSNTRSVMVLLALCLPLVWFVFAPRRRQALPRGSAGRAGDRQQAVFVSLVALALIAAPTAAAALFKRQALAAVVKLFTVRLASTFSAADTTHFKATDSSEQIRAHIFEYTIRRLDLVGHGMSEQIRSGFGYYPHLAYLQAFYDFGILGGLLYLALALVVPTMIIVDYLRGARRDPAATFAILYFIYGQGDQLGHTTPYGWTGLVGIVLVYVLVRPGVASRPAVSDRSHGRHDAAAASAMRPGGASA